MKATQDKRKSYVDQGPKPLEFEERDKVFLRISLVKGIRVFNGKGKLNPNLLDRTISLRKST